MKCVTSGNCYVGNSDMGNSEVGSRLTLRWKASHECRRTCRHGGRRCGYQLTLIFSVVMLYLRHTARHTDTHRQMHTYNPSRDSAFMSYLKYTDTDTNRNNRVTFVYILHQGCTTCLRPRDGNSSLQGRERGVRFWGAGQRAPPHQLLGVWGSAVSSPQCVWATRPQTHFGVFWARKSHMAATFSIIYFSWKSGNGALWCILKYAYTFDVPNNWKPPKIPVFGMNWNRTIRSCHKYEISNGPFFKSTVASHAGHKHSFRGAHVVHSCSM